MRRPCPTVHEECRTLHRDVSSGNHAEEIDQPAIDENTMEANLSCMSKYLGIMIFRHTSKILLHDDGLDRTEYIIDEFREMATHICSVRGNHSHHWDQKAMYLRSVNEESRALRNLLENSVRHL